MPSATHPSKPPSYRLHKARNQAFVQFRGRRFYLGTYGTEESKERYRRFLAEVWVKPTATPVVIHATPDITVVEVTAAYWQHAEAYYVTNGQPSGWLYHIRLVLRILRELYGTSPAAEFGPIRLKTLRDQLILGNRSRKYVNKLVGVVVRMFKWAAGEELIPGTTYQNLRAVEGLRKGRTPAPENPPIMPVGDSTVEATLPYLSPIVADMIRLQRLTGMRPGEVCAVRPCDVDRSGEVWTYRPASHKTEHHGRDRLVYIGPRGQDVLRPYLLREETSYCFVPTAGRRPGPCYTKDSYRRVIDRAVDRANEAAVQEAPIPHWHPNQLRHAAATEIRREYGLEATQVILGHAKADVTQVYAERDSRLAAEVARKIG